MWAGLGCRCSGCGFRPSFLSILCNVVIIYIEVEWETLWKRWEMWCRLPNQSVPPDGSHQSLATGQDWIFTGGKKGAIATVLCAEVATNTRQCLWSITSEGRDGLLRCSVSSIVFPTTLSWQPGHPLGAAT